MTVDDVTAALPGLTDEEFDQVRAAVIVERQRRAALPQVNAAMNTVAEDWHAANPGPVDEASGLPVWQAPSGAFNTWPVGVEVAHGGHTWRNVHSASNGWEPGEVNGQWERTDWAVLDPDNPADFDPDRAYKTGDRVLFEGSTWEAATDWTPNPTWNPGNAHGLWRKLADPEGSEVVEFDPARAYAVGDKVLWEGATWTALTDIAANTGWNPTVAHGNWQKVA